MCSFSLFNSRNSQITSSFFSHYTNSMSVNETKKEKEKEDEIGFVCWFVQKHWLNLKIVGGDGWRVTWCYGIYMLKIISEMEEHKKTACQRNEWIEWNFFFYIYVIHIFFFFIFSLFLRMNNTYFCPWIVLHFLFLFILFNMLFYWQKCDLNISKSDIYARETERRMFILCFWHRHKSIAVR